MADGIAGKIGTAAAESSLWFLRLSGPQCESHSNAPDHRDNGLRGVNGESDRLLMLAGFAHSVASSLARDNHSAPVSQCRGYCAAKRQKAPMMWYLFRTSWPDGSSDDARTTNLSDADAARRYAHLIIRELKERPDYCDSGLRMVVRDDNGDMIDVISF